MREALEGLDGVLSARVSNPRGISEVVFDPREVTVEVMIRAIEKAGFSAKMVAVKPAKFASDVKDKSCGYMGAFC